jgi:hypothetical protein
MTYIVSVIAGCEEKDDMSGAHLSMIVGVDSK